MKIARLVLKIIAASLVAAAAICAVIAYWDKIAEVPRLLIGKCRQGIAKCPCHIRSEYDDYADWDDSEGNA